MTATALERVQVALEEHGCRVTGSKAQCPAHDDRNPSLSITNRDGRVLLNCHAGCATQDVLAALNLAYTDLYDERLPPRARGAVREHPYQRLNGSLVGVAQRFEPKTYRPLTHNGSGWRQSASEELKTTPYRLPELIAAVDRGDMVYVTEGERDADTLAARGITATCNQGGAEKWTQAHAEYLNGVDVVVVRDADEAGHRHGDLVIRTLIGVASSVRLVEPATGKDVTEHFEAGHGLDQLVEVPLDDDVERYTAPHLQQIPKYPTSALVGPLRSLVVAGESAGLDPALVGGSGLAALGTVAGLAELSISETWIERPALWTPLIAPRGAGKTPAQGFAFRKIHELDGIAHEIYRAEMDDWLATPKKERGPRPVDPTRRLDDITIEMLARHLARGDGTAGIEADELSGWLKGIGRYRSSGDGGERGRWLALWSHKPWRYQRATDDLDLSIDRPVVSICGGLQPPLHHLLGGDEDGFRPRWLPHLGVLDASRRPARGKTADGWDETIKKLYDGRTKRTWKLPEDVYAQWSRSAARWKAASMGAETPSVSAALVKADVQCARIALVLAESVAPCAGGDITTDVMSAAIAIVDYVMDCWRALPEHETLTLSRKDEVLQQAVDQLADWLDQHGGRAPRRDLERAHVAGIRTADERDALLARYEAVYPGSVRPERTGKRGPVGIMVYAPRRGYGSSLKLESGSSGETVAGDSFSKSQIRGRRTNTAGQAATFDANETVATGDSIGGDSSQATVSDTKSDQPGTGAAERICRECSKPTASWVLDTRDGRCIDCAAKRRVAS